MGIRRTALLATWVLACGSGQEELPDVGPMEFASVTHADRSHYADAPHLHLGDPVSACDSSCVVSPNAIVKGLPDEGFVVADPNGVVNRYSSSGQRTASIDLPLGYRIAGVDLDTNDALIAFSLSTRTLSRFKWNGAMLENSKVRFPSGTEDFTVEGGRLIVFEVARGRTLEDTVTGRFLAHSVDGRDAFEIARRLFRARGVTGNEFGVERRLFAAHSVWTVDRAMNVYYSDGAQCRIEVFAPKSPAPRLITCAVLGDRVDRADIRHMRAELRRSVDLAPRPLKPSMKQDLQNLLRDLPARHPAITGLRVARHGELWIQHGSGPLARSRKWTAVAPDGRIRAKVELPEGMSLVEPYPKRLLVKNAFRGSSSLAWVILNRSDSVAPIARTPIRTGTGATSRRSGT